MRSISYIFILSLFSLFLNAQGQYLTVGIHTSPVYFHNFRKYPSTVYEYYEGLNRHQFYLSNGVALDFSFNKKLTLSINPSLFKRSFNSDCVNTKFSNQFGSYFYVSKDTSNCFYTIDATYSFMRLPLVLKYTIKRNKIWKLYLGVGNSINYGFKKQFERYDKITATLFSNEYKAEYFMSWFSPTIEGGFDYKIMERLVLNANLNIQTENPLISNFSFGIDIGAKVALF